MALTAESHLLNIPDITEMHVSGVTSTESATGTVSSILDDHISSAPSSVVQSSFTSFLPCNSREQERQHLIHEASDCQKNMDDLQAQSQVLVDLLKMIFFSLM